MGNKSTFWSVLNRSMNKQLSDTTTTLTTNNSSNLLQGHHHVDFSVVQHWVKANLAVKDAHDIIEFNSSTAPVKIATIVLKYAIVCNSYLQAMGLPKELTILYAEGSSVKSEQRGAAKKAERLNDAISASKKRSSGWQDLVVQAMGRPPLWFTIRVLQSLEKYGWKWVAAKEGKQADTLIINALHSAKSAGMQYVHSKDGDFLAFSPVNFTLVKRDNSPFEKPQLLEQTKVLNVLGMYNCYIYYSFILML